MPNIQTTKKRLSYSIFKSVISSQSIAFTSGIDYIGPCFFAYHLIESSKSMFLLYFDRKKLDTFLSFLLTVCSCKDKKKSESNTVRISKIVVEAVMRANRESDKVGPEHVLYILMKEDEKLKNIAEQHGITINYVLDIINKEANKKREQEKDVFGQQQNAGKKNSQQKSDVIAKYCVDFTQKAKDGLLSPVFCREEEMEQILISLMKKNKANPLLIGEAGTGKTAIVEGLAQRFVKNDVPVRLKGYRIISVHLASIVQGTTLRGQFEERLDEILKYVLKEGNVILFIDEIHTVIGAGVGSDPGLDAGNILKPYLARGDIKCIGATTFDDYYRYMRRDKALSRRFQRIFISEPEDSKTVEIIRGLAPGLEKYHNCTIQDDVFEYIVSLSRRFVSDRFFPDKAIDCLDHSCAKSSISDGIVKKEIVEEVIGNFSDVPISLIRQGDLERLEGMKEILMSEILGNETSITEFCNKIRFACSTKGTKRGVLVPLILYGPPGIGKKTIVKKMAEHLYGKNSIITINGAEYSESHSISRLVGSPPGYVGHEEETYILREVRRKPHMVLLIQNPDLMCSSVTEQFKQVIETGKLTDVHGMIADFSNCIVVFSLDLPSKSGKTMGFSSKTDVMSNYDSEFMEMKKSHPVFGAINYCIGFSDFSTDCLKDLIKMEIEKFVDSLKNCGIIVNYEDSCVKFFMSLVEGPPSEIRRKIREQLESSVSKGINISKNNYELYIENGKLLAKMKEQILESCKVQN